MKHSELEPVQQVTLKQEQDFVPEFVKSGYEHSAIETRRCFDSREKTSDGVEVDSGMYCNDAMSETKSMQDQEAISQLQDDCHTVKLNIGGTVFEVWKIAAFSVMTFNLSRAITYLQLKIGTLSWLLAEAMSTYWKHTSCAICQSSLYPATPYCPVALVSLSQALLNV